MSNEKNSLKNGGGNKMKTMCKNCVFKRECRDNPEANAYPLGCHEYYEIPEKYQLYYRTMKSIIKIVNKNGAIITRSIEGYHKILRLLKKEKLIEVK